LDKDQFDELRPVHGLIFLFKWRPGDEPAGEMVADDRLQKIFFAKQVIQNACATQAIVNLLLNASDSDIQLGEILTEFKRFTSGFDEANRGLCLTNSEPIREVHNSFARQHLFEMDMRVPEKDDNFHFITYIPIGGRVYELDGLRDGPIDLGAFGNEADWLETVRPVIEKRIQKYSEGEIHFNLMAVISDRKLQFEKRLGEIEQSAAKTTEKAMEEMNHLKALIVAEDEKAMEYKKENIRRRHNYIPFIVELLKILAKENKLVPLVKQAQEKAAKKLADERSKTGKIKSKT